MRSGIISPLKGLYRLLMRDRWPSRLGVVTFWLFITSPGFAAPSGYLSEESPPEVSVEEQKAPIEGGFKEDPKAVQAPARVEGPPSVWRDSTLNLNIRTYYFDRSRSPGQGSEAWALGGSAAFRSGWWRERLNFGATAYTSQKLYGPDDKDGTLLLKPGQEGFSVLGEAFVSARLTENLKARLYRQTFNLPYVNKNDSRMVPNTFEAYSFLDLESEKLRWGGAHLTKMKKRDSDEFVSMSEAAGFDGTDKDLSMVGAQWLFSEDTTIGAINHYAWDYMNTFYAEGTMLWRRGAGLPVRLSLQYTHQKSVGDEIGGDFSTYVFGGKLAGTYRNATLTFAFSSVSDDSGIRSPFGGYPGYLSLMIKDFDRADEDAWLVGFAYDFKDLGLNGLSTFINYAQGNTPDSGEAQSPDQAELDITADYRAQEGLLKGFWLRLRWAHVDQDNDASDAIDINDLRVIVNYNFPLL